MAEVAAAAVTEAAAAAAAAVAEAAAAAVAEAAAAAAAVAEAAAAAAAVAEAAAAAVAEAAAAAGAANGYAPERRGCQSHLLVQRHMTHAGPSAFRPQGYRLSERQASRSDCSRDKRPAAG